MTSPIPIIFIGLDDVPEFLNSTLSPLYVPLFIYNVSPARNSSAPCSMVLNGLLDVPAFPSFPFVAN